MAFLAIKQIWERQGKNNQENANKESPKPRGKGKQNRRETRKGKYIRGERGPSGKVRNASLAFEKETEATSGRPRIIRGQIGWEQGDE